MKTAIALALVAIFVCVHGVTFEQIMRYEIAVEAGIYNASRQMGYWNASMCTTNTHQIIDVIYNMINSASSNTMVGWLTAVRDLFLRLIDEIDYCPQMADVFNRFVTVFSRLATDTYTFVWNLANNIAANGIDIYYHIGYVYNLIYYVSDTRASYFSVGAVVGDMIYDIFFAS